MSNFELAASTKAVDVQLKLAFLTNPVFLAIAAGTTLVALLAFNVGGLRDIFLNLGKTIYDFLTVYFRPLADAMRWFYDTVLAPLGKAIDGSINPAFAETAQTLEYVQAETIDAGEALQDYADYLYEVQRATVENTNENYNFILSTGKLGSALNLSNQQIDLAAGYLRDLQREEQKTTTENFNLVASTFGLKEALSLTMAEITDLAGGINRYNEALEKMKDLEEEVSEKKDEAREHSKNTASRSGLAEAKEKYGNVPMVKVGNNWLPAADRMFNNVMNRAQGLQYGKSPGIDTPDEIRRYLQGAQGDKVTVNIIENPTNFDIEVIVGDKRQRFMRARSQGLYGST